MRAWTLAVIASLAVCCFGCCILRFWIKGVTLDGAAMVAVFMGVLSLGCCRCFSCHAWHVPTCRTPPGEGGVARVQGRGLPTLGEGAEGGTERAERSGGLHKRSAEDWGSPCAARGQRP